MPGSLISSHRASLGDVEPVSSPTRQGAPDQRDGAAPIISGCVSLRSSHSIRPASPKMHIAVHLKLTSNLTYPPIAANLPGFRPKRFSVSREGGNHTRVWDVSGAPTSQKVKLPPCHPSFVAGKILEGNTNTKSQCMEQHALYKTAFC